MSKSVDGWGVSERLTPGTLRIDVRTTTRAGVKALVVRLALYGVIPPKLATYIIHVAGLRNA